VGSFSAQSETRILAAEFFGRERHFLVFAQRQIAGALRDAFRDMEIKLIDVTQAQS
jgi:hypothetical protein